MASGTPVVAAATAALPETCGGAAVLVAPTGEAFRDALTQLVRRRRRARAIASGAGSQRASGFTWERTARRIDALIG